MSRSVPTKSSGPMWAWRTGFQKVYVYYIELRSLELRDGSRSDVFSDYGDLSTLNGKLAWLEQNVFFRNGSWKSGGIFLQST